MGFGIPKISTYGLGMPFGMPESVAAHGCPWTQMALKAPYLLVFRHKKRRPWTSLDVSLVEPGGFEPPSNP
jgi:hypothetical protein